MLSLRLKSGEYFTIGENVAVQVFKSRGDSIEVAVKAPREVPILRGELHERTDERPDGLRNKSYKRPSETAHNRKRAQTLQHRQQDRAAALECMASVLDEIEYGNPELKEKISILRRQMGTFEN